MKKIKRILAVGLVGLSLAAVIGTSVSAHNCTCGTEGHVYDERGNCIISCC